MPRQVQLARLVDAVGPNAGLTLVAFFGDRPTVYVPGQYRPGHLLERVLGEDGFLRLVANFGGETITLPRAHFDAERRLGAVYRGMKAGLTTRQIAAAVGISYRRVRQIEVAIKSGEPLTESARSA